MSDTVQELITKRTEDLLQVKYTWYELEAKVLQALNAGRVLRSISIMPMKDSHPVIDKR